MTGLAWLPMAAAFLFGAGQCSSPAHGAAANPWLDTPVAAPLPGWREAEAVRLGRRR